MILGTVQLGLPYGIANASGQPSQEVADEIVQTAWAGGVRTFDTAQGYGESEAVLGRSFRRCGLARNAQVISKLSPALSHYDAFALEASVRQSLDNLGIPSLSVLMFHREEQLPMLDGVVGDDIRQLHGKGLFQLFGISVYTPEAALSALRHPDINVVQLPASLFDRRFEAAGVFAFAERLGKAIHIRSALLQGVLCMEPGALPVHLNPLKPFLQEFRKLCGEHGLPPASLALAWLLRRYPTAHVLFGAETPEQVKKNLDLPDQNDTNFMSIEDGLESCLPPQCPELLNPSLWK